MIFLLTNNLICLFTFYNYSDNLIVTKKIIIMIAMMPLSHILRKCIGGCKLTKSQEKINHLIYMDNIKLFAKKEKEL